MSFLLEEVEPGVTRIRLRDWRGRLAGYDVSAYVVHGVLVDTGFPRARRDMLLALDGMGLRGVVVTHSHEDHAGNLPALAVRGIPGLLHRETEATLRERPRILPYRSMVWGRTPMLSGQVGPFDPSPLEVIPTPGHSPDHQVLWDPQHRIVASGDLYLGVKVRVAHEHESPRRLVESLRRVAALEPRLLLDAHRGPVESPMERLEAKIDWMEETIGEIVALAARGVGRGEIARRVLGREDLVGYASGGEYSKRGLVTAVLREASER